MSQTTTSEITIQPSLSKRKLYTHSSLCIFLDLMEKSERERAKIADVRALISNSSEPILHNNIRVGKRTTLCWSRDLGENQYRNAPIINQIWSVPMYFVGNKYPFPLSTSYAITRITDVASVHLAKFRKEVNRDMKFSMYKNGERGLNTTSVIVSEF